MGHSPKYLIEGQPGFEIDFSATLAGGVVHSECIKINQEFINACLQNETLKSTLTQRTKRQDYNKVKSRYMKPRQMVKIDSPKQQALSTLKRQITGKARQSAEPNTSATLRETSPQKKRTRFASSKALSLEPEHIALLKNFRKRVYYHYIDFLNQIIKTETSLQIYDKLKQLKRDMDSGEVSAGLRERIAASEGVNFGRQLYLEHVLLWVFCCESWFVQLFPMHQQEGVECGEILIAFNKAVKLAVLLPDTHIAVQLFEHQGVINLALKNYSGAIKSFQRMRDVSEELDDHEWEIRAYMHLGETFYSVTPRLEQARHDLLAPRTGKKLEFRPPCVSSVLKRIGQCTMI